MCDVKWIFIEMYANIEWIPSGKNWLKLPQLLRRPPLLRPLRLCIRVAGLWLVSNPMGYWWTVMWAEFRCAAVAVDLWWVISTEIHWNPLTIWMVDPIWVAHSFGFSIRHASVTFHYLAVPFEQIRSMWYPMTKYRLYNHTDYLEMFRIALVRAPSNTVYR